jgi:elongation factor P--(R)-beta-lysine ligase
MVLHRALAERRTTLVLRSRIIREIRNFFSKEGYLEVETPLRIPAPPPETYIDAIPADGWYLHTSPELCMKRMLAAGYDRLFQICHCWRGEERGSRHLPEFTMLEWYRSGTDYLELMEECELLVQNIVAGMECGDTIRYRMRDIRVSGNWERLSVKDAYHRYGRMTISQALDEDLFDEVMSEDIEPMLGLERPVFLYDYPAERGALARLKAEDPTVAERFELYIGGLEIANAFSELTDAGEQRIRFSKEAASRHAAGKTAYPLPEKFLQDLNAIPSAAGIALGVDRLVMVLLDAESIDNVVAFTPEEL